MCDVSKTVPAKAKTVNFAGSTKPAKLPAPFAGLTVDGAVPTGMTPNTDQIHNIRVPLEAMTMKRYSCLKLLDFIYHQFVLPISIVTATGTGTVHLHLIGTLD